MPKKELNQQLVRVVYPLLCESNKRGNSEDIIGFSHHPDCNDAVCRGYNWNARRGAMLLYTRYKMAPSRYVGQWPIRLNTSMSHGLILNRDRAGLGALSRLFQSVLRYDMYQPNRNTRTPTSMSASEMIDESFESVVDARTVFMWIHILGRDDIFRLCVSYL